MPLTRDEKLLVEAVQGMLSAPDRVGLKGHAKAHQEQGELERGLQHLHGHIDEMFAHKSAELVHHTSINAAFRKVHGYKYVDDPTFRVAMLKELTAQGVPLKEREKASEYVCEIAEELRSEQGDLAEADHGFHPDLDDLMKVPGGDDEPEIVRDAYRKNVRPAKPGSARIK